MTQSAGKTVEHYHTYKPRPFTRAERENVTILYGGLAWKHERLMQGALESIGYNAKPLPNATRADLETGKELIDTGACCPTLFITGSLANFLKQEIEVNSREQVAQKYVYVTAGACGPCRFGQYHQSYSMALEALGLTDLRMLLLAQDELSQNDTSGGGWEVNMAMSLGLIWAILCGDLLTDLEHITRPYEIRTGQTDAVLKESVELLYQAFRTRPVKGGNARTLAWHLFTNHFTEALSSIWKKWDEIEVDRLRVRAKVKITGEMWLQTHEGDGNYNIKHWLEQEDAEVVPSAVAVWLDYLLHPLMHTMEHRNSASGNKLLGQLALHAIERLYRRTYNGFRQALGNVPYELPDQVELKTLAEPYYHFELRGGEGHMLIGKALHTYHHKKAHMVCELCPYSCMPTTMSVGSMANVLGKYPDLLYAPIEIKGDSEVHAISRCQMILTEAKKRAHTELEEVMKKTGLTPEIIRRYESDHPEIRKATYQLPHGGYAGTAANYVMHVASKVGRVSTH